MKEEYFWSIVVEQDLVQAGIWTIRGDSVVIVATSGAAKWETDEDLVEKTDNALSQAIVNFPEDAKEPEKTVFGVPASWVEDGKIKKAHLEKIRLVSQKLSLSPTGFVVLPEAIAHSIKVREGSPLSGVVIGVGVGSLDLTVFRLGNIVGTVSVGRSTSVVEDVVEGLMRFSVQDNVPTRWLLYDGKEVDLEDVKQELVKTDWQETGPNLKFLHTPQVEIVDAVQKTEAVSIAGASELGEIKGVEGDSKAVLENNNLSTSSDFKPEDLGFVVDQDIVEHGDDSAQVDNFEEGPKQNFLKKLAAMLAGIPKLRSKLFSSGGATPMGLKAGLGKKKIFRVIGILAVLILVGAIAAWFYLSTADIVIYIAPKSLGESEAIVLDQNISSPDPGNFTFPARSVMVEVTSEKSRSATGTKTVGDRAKGKVIIRNGTASEVDFKSGTIIVGSNSLEFTLDEAITVPEANSPSSPGEVSVGVSASQIGEEYNLASGESFSVDNYPKSEVDAVSDGEFSGGTSREVTVVSESDINTLREELTEEVEGQALSRLEAEANGARFVPEAVAYDVIDESFTAKAGEEAAQVRLTMTVEARGIVLPEEQVEELSRLILKDQVPEGFSLRSEQVEAQFDLIDEAGDGVWEFDVNLTANLLPSINVDEIKKEVAGKHPQSVEKYLSSIPGYVRATIARRPKLPGLLGNLPRRLKNISIEIEAEQ